MTAGSEPLRIVRGRGGQVEVKGYFDAFAGHILLRAGFLSQPVLDGRWIRLPFDMGQEWENNRATWAAEMLTVARYAVYLDPDLRLATGQTTRAPQRPTSTTAQDTRPAKARPR